MTGRRKLVLPSWIFEVAPTSGVSCKDLRLMLGGMSTSAFDGWRNAVGFPDYKFRGGAGRDRKGTRIWLVRDVIGFAKRQRDEVQA